MKPTTLDQQDELALKNLIKSFKTAYQGKHDHVFWLSVDLRFVMRACSIHHLKAQAFSLALLKAFKEAIGDTNSVLVSAFNFTFPQNKVFDLGKTPVQTGAFGNFLIQNHPRHRMPHPFYSFCVFGPAENELLDTHFVNGTGENSIFKWLVDHNVELITVGHHYVKSLSPIHHVEELVKVPYRYSKTFEGELITADQTKSAITANFYVRELGVCDFSSLTLEGDQRLRDAGLIQTFRYGNKPRDLITHSLNLREVHQIMFDSFAKEQRPIIDYYGPARNLNNVITAKIADQLYMEELKKS